MRRLFLLPLLIALTACEAGHRDNPGVDNTWPGPELTVVQPGPEQIVSVPVEREGPTGYRMPQVFFDLRNLVPEAQRKGDTILYRIDGGSMREVTDWSKPIVLDEGAHEAGARLLLACVRNGKTNAPYTNPESMVVRRFYLGNADRKWEVWRPNEDPPRVPVSEQGPALLVTGPAARVRGTPRLTFAFKGRGFGTKYRVAYKINDGAWQSTHQLGPVALKDLAPGNYKMIVRLEQAGEKDDAGNIAWQLPPRPFFARKAADDNPQPGEFNLTRREFVVAP